MSPPPTGADAAAMTRAILLGDPFPPAGVDGTPENRRLWEAIIADIEAMPGGITPDIAADWTETPDLDPEGGPAPGGTGPGEPPPKAGEPAGPPGVAAGTWTSRLHPRDEHGRFRKTGGGAAPPAGVSAPRGHRGGDLLPVITAARDRETSPAARAKLDAAATALDAGDHDTARNLLEQAAFLAGRDGRDADAEDYRDLAATVADAAPGRSPAVMRTLAAYTSGAATPEIRRTLEEAGRRYQAGDWGEATRLILQAADAADAADTGPAVPADPAAGLRALAAKVFADITPPAPAAKPALARVFGVVSEAAAATPALLGGGTEKWDGALATFTREEHPAWAGYMDWDGSMGLLDTEAASLDAQLAKAETPGPGPVTVYDYDPFAVLLHEMIHGVEDGRTAAAAADWDALDRLDKSTLETFDRLDRDSAAGGEYPIAHTAAEIHAENLEILPGRLGRLGDAGLLARTGTSTWGADPVTGTEGWQPHWVLTGKARSMLPQPRYTTADHIHAYRDPATADIEEGFTELGTDMHMPGYLDAVGAARWQTGVLARGPHGETVDDPEWTRQLEGLATDLRHARTALLAEAQGPHDQATWNHAIGQVTAALDALEYDDYSAAADLAHTLPHLGNPVAYAAAQALAARVARIVTTPALRHATFAEYAARLADPARIRDGNAWGHYADKTARALEWCQAVARAEGKRRVDVPGTAGWRRVIALADEINREGPAGKLPVMARQVAAAIGDPDDIMYSTRVHLVMGKIRARWLDRGGGGAFTDARKAMRTGVDAAAQITFMAAAHLTRPGAQAAKITAWAWADPAARTAQATAQINALAEATADPRGLREVQDAARMLARLADGLRLLPPGGPGAPEAAGWDPRQPRDWRGRWARHGGSGGAGPDITGRAQAYIHRLRGHIQLRELDEYNTAEYEDTRLDPAFHYTEAQRAALDRYADHSYELNSAARGEPVEHPLIPPARIAADTAQISGAMQPMPDDLILLREIAGGDALADVEPGDVIADAAFASATLRPGRFAAHRTGTTILHILTPKGTPVAWVGRGEDEILFDRDTPMVMISKRPGWAQDTTDVNMLVLPKELAGP